MPEEPTLSPEARKGFLGEFGMSPTQPYEVGTGEEAVAEEPVAEPEAPAEEAQAPEPEPQAEPEPQIAEPATEEPAPEAVPAEPAAEEVSDLDYLNSLIPGRTAEAAAPEAASLSPDMIEALRRIAEARKEPEKLEEPAGEALDLAAVDWTSEGVQAQVQASLDRHNGNMAQAVGDLLNQFGQIIESRVVKPQVGTVRAEINKEKEALAMEAQQRTSWQNLATVPALVQREYENTMEATVATQFAAGFDGLGSSSEELAEGLSRSLLGRHILRNPKLALTQEGVMEGIITVAGTANLTRRRGKPQTVLTGTKEEVSGALSKAHGVEPLTKKEEEMTEEERILAGMEDAAQAHRGTLKKNVFFQ